MSKPKRADIPAQVRWVKVSDLTIGAQYQRGVKEAKVTRIAENFDPFQFGIPAANERADGSLHVTDGQHRILALRKMGWDDQMIQIEVISELPYVDEAGMHVDRNANRTATSSLDRFLGYVEAKRPMQVAIKNVLDERGLELVRTTKMTPNVLWCVSTLEKLYSTGGINLLTKTLDTIISAWGKESDAFQSRIVKAVGRLHEEYDRMIDDTRLVKSMKRYRPAEYVRRAEAGKELNRSNTTANLLVAIVADYNNLPGGRKLPPATELVMKPHARTHRVKQVERAQMIELAGQGYSKAEIKVRYPNASLKYIGNIIREVAPKRRRSGRKGKAKAS